MEQKEDNYQIISLGTNCFVRAVLTEYNLIKTKRQGRKSMPFDLACHEIKVAANHIDNDFYDYLEGISFNIEDKYIRNKKTDSLYPHDKDCLKNSEKFETRYKNRIENFKEAISYDTFTFFVLWGEYTEEDLNIIYQTLSEKRKDKPFKIIVWNYGEKEINTSNPNISVFTRKRPAENWNWDNEDVKKEKRSVEYKKALIDFTKKEIEKSGFDLVIYRKNIMDILAKKEKVIIKKIFSIDNDWDNHYKFVMILGKKFKIKDLENL